MNPSRTVTTPEGFGATRPTVDHQVQRHASHWADCQMPAPPFSSAYLAPRETCSGGPTGSWHPGFPVHLRRRRMVDATFAAPRVEDVPPWTRPGHPV